MSLRRLKTRMAKEYERPVRLIASTGPVYGLQETYCDPCLLLTTFGLLYDLKHMHPIWTKHQDTPRDAAIFENATERVLDLYGLFQYEIRDDIRVNAETIAADERVPETVRDALSRTKTYAPTHGGTIREALAPLASVHPLTGTVSWDPDARHSLSADTWPSGLRSAVRDILRESLMLEPPRLSRPRARYFEAAELCGTAIRTADKPLAAASVVLAKLAWADEPDPDAVDPETASAAMDSLARQELKDKLAGLLAWNAGTATENEEETT